MKVGKVLSRFASAPEDASELRRMARALGEELSRQRLSILQQFRAGLAHIKLSAEDSFAAGYVASLLDVTAEYEIFVQQADDQRELHRLAVREEWRKLLVLMSDGPRLPSELATQSGKDRPTITRVLRRLRAAGLVRAYADPSIDGRMRPHRLTVDGRRLLDQMAGRSPDQAGDRGLDTGQLPEQVASGIAVAIGLFRHLVTHSSSPAPELDIIAQDVLNDSAAARSAVRVWAQKAKEAGLIDETSGEIPGPMAAGASGGHEAGKEEYHLSSPPAPAVGLDAKNDALWHSIPSILTQLEHHKPERVPVYVRTTTGAWGAWAYALHNRDATGMSRAIVDGDILAGSIEPPERRFDLLYDDPQAIAADRGEPAMQALMDRADEKFVVSSSEEDVPEDFIQLKLAPGIEE